jgi:hypothetical protein
MQSVAQFPFQNAILKIESKKKERACRALFLFYYSRLTMGTRTAKAGPTEELSVVRRKISELVARHAVPMVQQAIDAVREEGQYQAMKFLFEMVGLYPATAQEESPVQESLARLLLDQLGLPNIQPGKQVSGGETEITDRHPLE